jgi:hypothetical protein
MSFQNEPSTFIYNIYIYIYIYLNTSSHFNRDGLYIVLGL